MTTCVVRRFWSKVDVDESGCWLWVGAVDPTGYGRFAIGDRMAYAHRFAYELFVGSIPEGLSIDHVAARGCHHRHCVNPDHLEPVTQRENLMRGDTLTVAHAEGRDCGFPACRSCQRLRLTPCDECGRPSTGRLCSECEHRAA